MVCTLWETWLDELFWNRPLWISQLKFPVNFGQVLVDKSGDKSWQGSTFWGALLDSIKDLLPLDLRWFAFRLPEATEVLLCQTFPFCFSLGFWNQTFSSLKNLIFLILKTHFHHFFYQKWFPATGISPLRFFPRTCRTAALRAIS